jgi:hypothetical protein
MAASASQATAGLFAACAHNRVCLHSELAVAGKARTMPCPLGTLHLPRSGFVDSLEQKADKRRETNLLAGFPLFRATHWQDVMN